MKIAVLYMPVLHEAYFKFLTQNGKFDTVFLIDEKLFKEVDEDLAYLFEKNLSALPVVQMQKALISLELCDEVRILDENNLKEFAVATIPDDDIVEKILSLFYPLIDLIKKDYFLRWGRKTVLSQRAPVADATISLNDLDREIMSKGFELAKRSSDWWRQVGAILFPVNGDSIESFNHHLPHQEAPNIFGDPRTNFKPGIRIDLSTAVHAEAGAIAYAARKGVSLEGASIYVTTFPCPGCAGLIRESGIKKVYYCEGYSLLSAAEILKPAGISLIFVDVPN